MSPEESNRNGCSPNDRHDLDQTVVVKNDIGSKMEAISVSAAPEVHDLAEDPSMQESSIDCNSVTGRTDKASYRQIQKPEDDEEFQLPHQRWPRLPQFSPPNQSASPSPVDMDVLKKCCMGLHMSISQLLELFTLNPVEEKRYAACAITEAVQTSANTAAGVTSCALEAQNTVPEEMKISGIVIIKKLLEGALLSCPFKERGCSKKLKGYSAFQEHTRVCEMRVTFHCWWNACGKQFETSKALVAHYIDVHSKDRRKLVTDADDNLTLAVDYRKTMKGDRRCALYKYKGHVYLLASHAFDGKLLIWVWDLEHDDDDCEGGTTNTKVMICLRRYRPRSSQVQYFVSGGFCFHRRVSPDDILMNFQEMPQVFQITLEKFNNHCFESTPNGSGMWNVLVHMNREEE